MEFQDTLDESLAGVSGTGIRLLQLPIATCP